MMLNERKDDGQETSDVVLMIRIRGGLLSCPRRSSTGSLAMARSPSLAPAVSVLLLRQQLNQRHKRRRRQGHAPLQSLEQAGKAALGNDLAGALQIGPDRSAGRR